MESKFKELIGNFQHLPYNNNLQLTLFSGKQI